MCRKVRQFVSGRLCVHIEFSLTQELHLNLFSRPVLLALYEKCKKKKKCVFEENL